MGFYIIAVIALIVACGLWFMASYADYMSDAPTGASNGYIFWIGFAIAALLVICGYFSQ